MVPQVQPATCVTDRMRFRDWPLALKLAVVLVAMSLVPLIGLTVRDVHVARERHVASESALLAARADQLVDNLDQFNTGYTHAASRLAHVPEIIAFLAAPGAQADLLPALTSRLRVHIDGDPAVRGIAVIDATGIIRGATEEGLIGRTRGFRHYAQLALAGTATISDPYLADTLDDHPTIAYATPVRGPAGQVIGLVAVWVRAQALWNVADHANGLAGAGSYAVIYDREGIRIAHTARAELLFQPAGVLEPEAIARLAAERRLGHDTAEQLASVRPFAAQFVRARSATLDETPFTGVAPGTVALVRGLGRRLRTVPWTVFYMVPEATLAAPIDALIREHVVVTVVVGLAALAASALLASVLLRPIRRLVMATHATAAGDLSIRLRPRSADELGSLGRAFDDMTERLEAQARQLHISQADLEARVEARTQELATSEHKYRDLFDGSPDMYATVDLPSRLIVETNETLCRRLGYRRAELVGQPYDILYAAADQLRASDRMATFHEAGEFVDVERQLVTADGRKIEVSLNLRATRDSTGAIIGARGVFRDISRRKQGERDRALVVQLSELLRSSTTAEAVLLAVTTKLGEHLAVARCTFVEIDSSAGTVTYHPGFHPGLRLGEPAVPRVLPLSGFSCDTADEFAAGTTVVLEDTSVDPRTRASYATSYGPLGMRASIVVPLLRDGQWVVNLVVSTPEPRAWEPREVDLVRVVAERVWSWIEHLRVLDELRVTAIELAVRQAEERQEDALRQALREREVLLQEIHHRVKNNLQVISSLLRMQLRRLEPGVARAALEETQMRVLAIAQIHETLYEAKDYARVQFADYTRSLVQGVFHATGMSAREIALDVDIGDVSLSIDRAIPCGLVINELITNALKHGFADGRAGQIRVELARVEGARIRLRVTNDGIPLPAAFSLTETTSMGLQLVCTLARQLDGAITVTTGTETSFQLLFPETHHAT